MDKDSKNGCFGVVLKCIRITQNLAVKELAEIMDVNSSYICDVEAGRRRPSLSMFYKFSEGLNVPLSKIVEWEEKAKSQNLTYQQILTLAVRYCVENGKELQR